MRLRTLGERLRAVRSQEGVGQAELARRLSVDKGTVWRWEHDRCEPRRADLERLAGELGVALEWLKDGVGQGPNGLQATGS